MNTTEYTTKIRDIIKKSISKRRKLFNEEMIEEIFDKVSSEISLDTFSTNLKKAEHLAKKIVSAQASKVLIKSLKKEPTVINLYLEYYWDNSENAEDNLNELVTFFGEISYNPTIDFYFNLFEMQPKIVTALNRLFKKLQPPITLDLLEAIPYYNNISQIIDAYISHNNIDVSYDIELEEEEEIENKNRKENDYYFADPTKAYLMEISRIPLLKIDEERYMLEQIAQGNASVRDKFIESNLRLVVSIAKKRLGRGLELLDLVSEGNFGLMKAVDRYKLSSGNRFSTYATWWIRQAIDRAIADHGSTIRKPVHMRESFNKLARTQANLVKKIGREPTTEEIAKELGWTVGKVEEVWQNNMDTVSIHTIVGDEDTELEHFIPDTRDNYAEVMQSDLSHSLFEVINRANLDERSIEVLKYRFGFYDGRVYTLEEVGQIYGVTRERIRQIENKALKKIRKNSRTKLLADYLESPKEGINYIEEQNKNFYNSHSNTTSASSNLEPKTITIYDFFSQYTKESIDGSLIMLDVNDLELLQRKFGSDLKSGIDGSLTQTDELSFQNVLLPKIRKYLTPLPKKNRKGNESLFVYFGAYKKEYVLEALNVLTDEELKIVKKKFGADFESGERGALSSGEAQRFSSHIVHKILEPLQLKQGSQPSTDTVLPEKKGHIKKKTYSIYNHYNDYTKEEIDKVLSQLSVIELELLRKKFGQNLTSGVGGTLDKKESSRFNVLNVKIKKMLAGTYVIKNAKSLEKKKYSLYDNFANFSKEQIDIALLQLSLDEQALLRRKFGDDFISGERGVLSNEEKKKYNVLHQKLMRILNKKTDKRKQKEIKESKSASRKITYSLFDYLSEFSEAEIVKALQQMPMDEIKILKKRFGDDYKSGEPKSLMQKEIAKLNATIMPRMKRILAGTESKIKKRRKTINEKGKISLFVYFSEFERDSVIKAVSLLTDKDQIIIRKKYGDDLDSGEINAISKAETLRFLKTISKQLLNYLENGIEPVKEETKKEKDIILYSLFEYFSQYSEEQVREALLLLSLDEINLIKKKYGDDYKSGVRGALDKKETRKFYVSISKKIRRILEGKNVSKKQIIVAKEKITRYYSVFEYFKDYDEENILLAIEKLEEQDRIILKKKFGEDYRSGIRGTLNEIEARKFNQTISKKMRKILSGEDINRKQSSIVCEKSPHRYSLFEMFSNYSEEEILKALSTLTIDEINLVKKKYGEDYKSGVRGVLSKQESRRFYATISKKITMSLEGQTKQEKGSIVKKEKTIKHYSIFEYFKDYDEESILSAIEKLEEEDRNILKKKYGEDYRSGIRGALNETEARKFSQTISKKIRRILSGESDITQKKSQSSKVAKNKRIYSLFDALNDYTKEDVTSVLNHLEKEEISLLQKKYGVDYESGTRGALDNKSSIVVYNRIIPKIKRLLSAEFAKNNQPDIISVERDSSDFFGSVPIIKSNEFTKDDYCAIRDYLNRSEFKDALSSLDLEDAVLSTLILIKINGKTIPFDIVTKLYDLNEEELKEIIKQGLIKIKEKFDKAVDEFGYEYIKKWNEVI